MQIRLAAQNLTITSRIGVTKSLENETLTTCVDVRSLNQRDSYISLKYLQISAKILRKILAAKLPCYEKAVKCLNKTFYHCYINIQNYFEKSVK